MKILAINGSYRKKGNTVQILEMVASKMQQIALDEQQLVELEIVNLGHQKIQLCCGCRVCFDVGESKCPLDDGLLTVRAKMQVADGLILASPVYVNDVNGITKNWIDRLAFICHRPEFAGKSAYLIVTVGIGPTSHAIKTMKMALSTWGYQIAGQASFKMGARMKKEAAEAQFQEQTHRIARKLYRSVQQHDFVKPSFISLMTFRIQQGYWQRRPQDKSLDHSYWKSQGWTKPRRDYYTSHKAVKAKVALARLVGMILTPFVT
jgi:multimeric flavodoxin WrbA